MGRIAITSWCQDRIRQLMPHPVICVDATAGTGKDTLFLCGMVPEDGQILAMDIQEDALKQARERITKAGYEDKVTFVLDGHEHMDQYVNFSENGQENCQTPQISGPVDLIMFNLGYLPGGDHKKATTYPTTMEAIEKGLSVLRKGGLMTLMIYSGGDSGFEERDALLPFLKELDHRQYTVIVESFYNKPNTPPLPVYILKE